MSAGQGNESGVDEQYEVQRSPVEREFADEEDGSEAARKATVIGGLTAGMIVAIVFILFVVVLLGYVIANAL